MTPDDVSGDTIGAMEEVETGTANVGVVLIAAEKEGETNDVESWLLRLERPVENARPVVMNVLLSCSLRG
jgi:hypothetical protein